ncbi:MAG TPA: hypothetical protein DC000_04370 [Clostridiales bacterium]|nr:hypothetical protein [Clostridiales bacterium]
MRRRKRTEYIEPHICKDCRKCKIKTDVLGDCLDLDSLKLNININTKRVCKNFLGGTNENTVKNNGFTEF